MTVDAELDRLRSEVREVDAALLRALEQRFRLAREIGSVKVDGGRALRDYAVERGVVQRWRAGLESWGVPVGRSEALAQWIIEESLRMQEGAVGGRSPDRGSKADVAIVGGAGAMGVWLGDFLEDAGHRVAVVDPNGAPPGRGTLPDVETAVRKSEVVVFATPIRQTGPLLKKAVAVPSETLILDVLSVKAPILPILKDAARQGRRVSSLHPMFGPSARTLSGRNLLVVSCGVPEADLAARSLFSSSAVSITEVTLDQHDRLIAESLGLSHAVNLLFLATLASDPLSPHDLARAASTTFRRQASLARALAREGPDLYLDIQSLNPHTWGTYDELREALATLQDLVERHDGPAFRTLLEAGAAKLEEGPGGMRA
jgi:chorismate mutase / prephenate dehydrogenase